MAKQRKRVGDTRASGGFFKPADHMTDLALLIEPRSIARDVPDEYRGQPRVRDEVIADVSIFANSQDIEERQPSEIQKSVKIAYKYLVNALAPLVPDSFAVVTVGKGESAYFFNDVDDEEINEAVDAYLDARDAEAESAPDFD